MFLFLRIYFTWQLNGLNIQDDDKLHQIDQILDHRGKSVKEKLTLKSVMIGCSS